MTITTDSELIGHYRQIVETVATADNGLDALPNYTAPPSDLFDAFDTVYQVLAALCADLFAMRDEIRTRRLVVVDEFGAERITTTCDDDRTMLRIGIDDLNDDLGVGHQTDATVYIEAELERTGNHNGRPFALAQVQCSTGDDAFAILEQRSIIGESRGDRTVTDRACVHLHQQRTQASYSDNAMNTVSMSIVEVGPDGVVERDVAGDLIAHAPMQRSVR